MQRSTVGPDRNPTGRAFSRALKALVLGVAVAVLAAGCGDSSPTPAQSDAPAMFAPKPTAQTAQATPAAQPAKAPTTAPAPQPATRATPAAPAAEDWSKLTAQALIERLASTDAAVRAKAETETENRGKALLPDLRRNRTNADPAVAHAARLWATALALPAHRRDDPRATIVTDQGTIVLELFEDSAPNTVGNFVYLADKKFFDHGVFHRVEDWVVQGGDPKGDGTGGPGYQFSNEVNWDSLGLNERKQAQLRRQGFESTPGLKSLPNVIGAVAMAHAGPGTDGSQFYILRKGAPWLNGAYTVFAQVIDGMEVVDQFENGSRPKIVSIRIENERPHKYVDGAHGPSKEPR